MSKATEAALAELHGAVAETLTAAMRGVETETGVLNPPAAATIMAAITFLKNNNITADASSNSELQEMQRRMTELRDRNKKRMSPRTIADVAAELDRDLGGDTEGMLQ